MNDRKLPTQFAELERFTDKWDLPDTNSRYRARLSSSLDELRDFHDAVLPRGKEIITYLDGKRFSQYSQGDLSLARLMFALAIVAQAVEIYKSVAVPDTGSASFNVMTTTELIRGSALMPTA